MSDILSETIAENDEYENEESDYDSREDSNYGEDSYDEDSYEDDYYDYLPSDRHWSEDDSEFKEPPISRTTSLDIPSSECMDITNEVNILDNILEKCQDVKDDIELVKEKLQVIALSTTCVVCLNNKVQILTIPCGHVVMCGECCISSANAVSNMPETAFAENSLEKCPMCRIIIERKIIARLP
jgi:Zinc finger, C3HC4 type (RING finger)